MKSAQLPSRSAGLPPVEEDLALRMKALFERCPALYGFTVQDWPALLEEFPSLALERERVAVSHLGIFPDLGATQREEIYHEVATALLDFLSARPAAKDMLRGRTIARVLH